MQQTSTMELATEEDACFWRYRGEGAANIVLDYTGSSPFFAGKVLRIRKISSSEPRKKQNGVEEGRILAGADWELWAGIPGMASATCEEELQHAYVRDVIMPLLGPEYVDPGVLISVSNRFLASVASNIRNQRPLSRSEISDVDESVSIAVLISDHTVVPSNQGVKSSNVESSNIAVEIKPKWGFLPESDAISVENAVKKTVSRFEMHQHLKMAVGQIKNPSLYSPLDFFSGNVDAMNNAVRALFATPHNNLRVFVNGNKVVSGLINDTTNDVEEAGSANSSKKDLLEGTLVTCIRAPPGMHIEVFQGLLVEILNNCDLLKRILAIQKLDSHDIEGAIHVFHSFLQVECAVCSSSQEFSISPSGQVTLTSDSYLLEVQKRRQEIILWLHSLASDEQKRLLRNFLLSATIKDCSLMISLQACHSSEHEEKYICCPITGQRYFYKVSVFDLDLKPIHKMQYYLKLDQEITELYMRARSKAL